MASKMVVQKVSPKRGSKMGNLKIGIFEWHLKIALKSGVKNLHQKLVLKRGVQAKLLKIASNGSKYVQMGPNWSKILQK